MVNLLKFHATANYPDDYEGERGTGVDVQRRYGESLLPMLGELGIRSVVRNQVVGAVAWLGDNQDWDMVTVVYYPSHVAFVKLVTSEVYHVAGVHKHAALERDMTIVTLPGGPVVDPATPKGN